jgi:hypothetical protein
MALNNNENAFPMVLDDARLKNVNCGTGGKRRRQENGLIRGIRGRPTTKPTRDEH